MTAKQVAERLNCSSSAIRRLAAKGRIPSYRVGDEYRFEIDEVLRAMRTPAASTSKAGVAASEG